MRHVLGFVVLVVLSTLVGCGSEEEVAATIFAGCTVKAVDGGASGYELSCPNQPKVFVANGRNGLDGKDGEDGLDGQDGKAGQDGADGANGEAGKNGHASVIAQTPAGSACPDTDGVTILTAMDLNDNMVLDEQDGNIQSATLCEGTDGASAPVTPFMPVAIVDPCGATPGFFNEVFLRLANGQMLASMSDNMNGANTRLSMLAPGCYMTTDGTACSFCVDTTNGIFNERRL